MSIHLRNRLLAIALACLLSPWAGASAQGNAAGVAGAWALSVIETREARTIQFTMNNGQLTGYYVQQDGKHRNIDNVSYRDGVLRFHVPGVGSFEVKGTPRQLRGTLSSEVNKSRSQVTMTRLSG